MTGILALTTPVKEGNKMYDYTIVCTDGQASYTNPSTGVEQKEETVRKLFVVGDSFVAGTGNLSVLQSVVQDLSRDTGNKTKGAEARPTPSQLCDAILQITERDAKIAAHDTDHHRKIHTVFLVAGREYDGTQTTAHYTVTPFGRDRGAYRNPSFRCLGSAAAVVEPEVQSLYKQGFLAAPADLEEAFFQVYTCAMSGSGQLYVNDKLQFGLISPERTVFLAHPSIDVRLPPHFTLEEYMSNLAVIRVPLQTIPDARTAVTSELAFSPWRELMDKISPLLRDFYFEFMNALSDLHRVDIEYNHLSARRKQGTTTTELIDRVLEKRTRAKEQVHDSIEVLKNPTAEKLNKFVEQQRKNHQGEIETALSAVHTPI